MSISSLFDIGMSGMRASQTALAVTGNNIANINTPGYSRQEVVLETTGTLATHSLSIGMGVSVIDIRRSYDRFIQTQLSAQYQNQGSSDAQSQISSQIEQLFNEAGDSGLSTALTDFFNSWQDVASNPGGLTERTSLISKANTFVLSVQRTEQGILDTLKGVNGQVKDAADRINSLAQQIEQLNKRIGQEDTPSGSGGVNALKDQRDNLLNELGKLVEFTAYEDQGGSMTVTVGMRNLVSPGGANILSAEMNADGDYLLSLDGVDVTSRITKGQVGGLIKARDDIESKVLSGLRLLVSSVANEVNTQHRLGFDLDRTRGGDFFSLTGTSPSDVIRTLQVAVSDPRKIAAASFVDGVPGDNKNALSIADLINKPIGDSTNPLYGATITEYYSGIVANVGSMSRTASDNLEFDNNLLAAINDRREAVSGVSLDEEAANLIRFQRSFEASARMITVTDELLQTVLGLG